MNIRERMLFENEALKCAIFLDPRINYRDSAVISDTVKNEAIVS